MKTVEIFEITIDDAIEANKNENYPNSGLFIVKTEIASDLRFIDKNSEYNYCIAPANMFLNSVELKHVNETVLEPVQSEKYEANFILEFSRILLNRKQL